MPGRSAAERTELSRVGAYARWIATERGDATELARGEAEARARLALMQAKRRLTEAAHNYTAAEQQAREVGLVAE
jgi:hypothetical protein